MGRTRCPSCEKTWTSTVYRYHPICQSCIEEIDTSTLQGAVTIAYLEARVDEGYEAPANPSIIKLLAPWVPLSRKLEES